MISVFALLAAFAVGQAEGASPPAEAEPPPLIRALQAAGLDPRTKLEDGAVQVMSGQRAVVEFDAENRPTLSAVETGRIDRAAPAGAADVFKGIRPGRLAVALDAAPEKRQSMMKIWNALARPVAFEAEIVALRGGQLMRKRLAVCPIAAGGAAFETWPDPIIAVVASGFYEPSADAPACKDEND
ncbi:MAG: hypothetical protein ACK41C_09775 [Phenylobacterium sp.]|uniref:hypothetical protein n=1 Tax=Phenylobacterium sp. TaxID=1871053 RepID=UPI00391CD2DF